VSRTVAIVMPLAEQRGGGEMMLLHLVRERPSADLRWLVVLLEAGELEDELHAAGIQTVVLNAGRMRQIHRVGDSAAMIARISRGEHATAILGWMAKGQIYGGVAAMLARLPAVWYQLGIPSRRSVIDRLATALPAQGVLACSRAGALAQSSLAPRRRISVVHPGVELSRFDPAVLPAPADSRQLLGLPATGPVVGIVGRMQRWKGIHVLVEAMPEILHRYPTAHCVVVGGRHDLEPGYEDELRRLIANLDLDAHVLLTGRQREIPLWMQAMDVVVHASRNEPFGIVVTEAMALAKPVVATDEGGPTEIITNGVDGLLVPYGHPSMLAAAILRYLDDSVLAARVGTAARRRAEQFSTARYAAALATAVQGFVASAR
jgi:glycosyltransferase involved in cell wall biosynthesis